MMMSREAGVCLGGEGDWSIVVKSTRLVYGCLNVCSGWGGG